MAVMPVFPVASAPSTRSPSSDGSATDPSGFGSLLGGVDVNSSDGGESTGSALGAPAPRPAAKPVPARSDAGSGGSTGSHDRRDEPANDAAAAQPAKDAEPAKSALPGKSDKGLHLARGHDKAAQGKGKAEDGDQTDDTTQAGLAQTAVTSPAANATGTAAAATPSSDATGVAPVGQAPALAAAAPGGDTPAALTPALLAAADAGSAAPQTAAAPLAAATPDAANAPTAFGSAVLDAALAASPLTGTPATATASDAPAPSIAASLLASLKSSSNGGAPAAALAPTGASPQSVAAAPTNPPIHLAATLPEVSAAPSATPQASIAPGIAAIAALLPETAADATPIIVQPVAARAITGASAPLHGKSMANGVVAGGLPAGSFGSASVAPGAIPALSAALLGGSDDQLPDLSEGELSFGDPELMESRLPGELAKSAGETESEAALPGAPSAVSQSFAAALAHSDVGPTNNASQGAPAQAPTAPPSTMPPMPALQIMPSLAKAAGDGGGHFNIQLHPQELGRVRVELDIDHDGHVTAAISAAHPATLELLRRDAQALQQALTDAGLKTDGNALSFNLQGDGQDMAERSGRSPRGSAPVVPPAADPLADAAPGPASSVSLGAGLVAVDIRI